MLRDAIRQVVRPEAHGGHKEDFGFDSGLTGEPQWTVGATAETKDCVENKLEGAMVESKDLLGGYFCTPSERQ